MKKHSMPRSAVEKFLSENEGKKVKVLDLKLLGSGWHGSGYSIRYRSGPSEKNAVLRMLSPVSFSHDYPSDRAAVFLLQNKLFNRTPGHVRSVGVGGVSSSGELISISDAVEFFQVVETASGTPYVNDLERIAREGALSASDIKRAGLLSDHLVKLHSVRFRGSVDAERSIRLRHLRDCIGHGEMLMGVIDTYPDKNDWAEDDLFSKVISAAVKRSMKLRGLDMPLVRMHGDFHPGNIWFDKKDKFTLLDASREEFGVPADDITALTINYIWFALKTMGKFDGPFRKLFDKFWNNYHDLANDKFLYRTAPLFFSFRAAVVAHPTFYPDQPAEMRKKMFNFILNSLDDDAFSPDKIDSYIKG